MFDKVKKTVKHTFFYSLGNVSSKLVGFILLPIYTRQISVADYGVLGLFEAMNMLGVAVCAMGLYQGLLRWQNLSDDENERKRLAGTVFLFLLGMCGILTAPTILFREPLSLFFFKNTGYNTLFILLALAVSFRLLGRLELTLLRNEERSLFYSVCVAVQFTVSLILNILFVAALRIGSRGQSLFDGRDVTFEFMKLRMTTWVVLTVSFELFRTAVIKHSSGKAGRVSLYTTEHRPYLVQFLQLRFGCRMGQQPLLSIERRMAEFQGQNVLGGSTSPTVRIGDQSNSPDDILRLDDVKVAAAITIRVGKFVHEGAGVPHGKSDQIGVSLQIGENSVTVEISRTKLVNEIVYCSGTFLYGLFCGRSGFVVPNVIRTGSDTRESKTGPSQQEG